MKNVYMFQPNYIYGNQAHIPYAIGTLAAYAWHEPEIKENYCLKKLHFLRDDIDKTVAEMENPFIAAFSAYIWNFTYNITMAKAIKKAYPDCVIVFGGHQIAPDNSTLTDYDFIDIVIQGEGEEPFLRLLRSYISLDRIEDIPNIAYRKNGELIIAKREYYNYCDYPSPYLEGTFEPLFREYPDIEFVFLYESNRGCPYHCAFCDWGTLKGKMRQFSEERTLAEFRWMADHKLEFCGCADSNFGLFERDSYYIDKLIELKNETGYPKKFQASFAKNNSQRIFEIGLKLSENGMNKGVTLAFQSMSPDALKIIGRTNITVDFFKELMNKYNEAHIPTYTELILGLPGETYDSFAGGIDELLEAGQHHSIYIHNCELLPGSDLGDPEFIKKYDIKANIIPLNQPHMSFLHADSIPEYSRIVTSTFSMNEEDWIKTNIFSDFVQCFHHLGMLEFFALYSYFELGIKYRVFFENLIEYFRSRKEGFVHSVIADIESRYRKIIDGNGELTAHDDRFGDVLWSFDEFAFLNIIDNFRGFYKEAKGYLETLGIEKDILENLLEFQIIMLKKPGDKSENELECDYDFLKYFSTAFLNEKPVLEKRKTHYKISGAKTYDSIADYARFVVWYGRKDSRNIYDKDVRTV